MTIKFNLSKIKKHYPNLNCKKKNFLKIQDQIFKILSKSDVKKEKIFNFSEFGKILFPYNSMGKIKSFHLFNANEFIIFFLYLMFKKQKKTKVADLGANLGLHSIVLDKCGYKVDAYEPDPQTFLKLKKNIALNNCKNIKIFNMAIYNKTGMMNFTRVKDNMTGSHLGKLKESYGKKEFLKVKIQNIKNIINKFDLIKMDIESAEAKVICSLKKEDFLMKDFIIEVGNKKNSKKIFDFLRKNNLKFYSQKNNFKLINKFSQMPIEHKDGAFIITQNRFHL